MWCWLRNCLEAKQFGLFHWTLEPSSLLYPSSTSSRCWRVPKRGKLCSFALCRLCLRGENTQMASWPQELCVETAEFQAGTAIVPGGGLTTEWAVCAASFWGAMEGSPSAGLRPRAQVGFCDSPSGGPCSLQPSARSQRWPSGRTVPGPRELLCCVDPGDPRAAWAQG